MTQTTNRFFDEIGRLMNDAAGAAQGVKREFDTVMRAQAERILRDLDVVKREEFDAVKDMARLAREENEALKARIAALEAKLGGAGKDLSTSSGSAPRAEPGISRFRVRCSASPRNDDLKAPTFPCHFRTLGLKARQLRSPRTPGGLLRGSA
jgi:BMFP domain-containing protein YqiC